MNVLLLTSHSIAEYDDLRMLTDLGYATYSIGGAYSEVPFEGKRPALANIVRYPELEAATDEQRARLEHDRGSPDQRPQGGKHYIDWAKADLASEVVDWADVMVIHHYPEAWLEFNWPKFLDKRVVWRTCGQSGPDGSTERFMSQFRGLQIVRYSPKERLITDFAGEDALIRFGKYPGDYGPWLGDKIAVGNITQNMAQRGDACGYGHWLEFTRGLPTMPAGPGSEALGGIGELSYPDMVDYLRHIRAYLYTGTHPASYTLGLMEAMLSGVPTIAVPWMTGLNELNRLFEAPDILPRAPVPDAIPGYLRTVLEEPEMAARHGEDCRQRALELFDVAVVGPQWKAFLG